MLVLPEFRNEPYTDFSEDVNRRAMEREIQAVEAAFGREYPVIVDGKEVSSGKVIQSLNPSQPSQVVGVVSAATKELADQAIRVANRAFAEWSATTPEARASVLLRAANIMRKKRLFLDALMVLEAGKSWLEADADVAEAIDFCEFYAREALRYGGPQPVTPLDGEATELFYIPLGVVVVIPPWNFPLAITNGMTSAALVSGNTVVLKPASYTPVLAYELYKVYEEAGVPPGVLNFLPGSGSEIGDFLVKHPLTRMIAFTGSKEVGLRINRLAAEVSQGQKWLKRVIAEMGGKDAIIVDASADLDAAVKGIVASAYGFQGQKCSACSRLIVVQDVYDTVLDRVVESAKTSLKMGAVKEFANNLGPVISQSAMNTILKYIDIGKKEARLVLGGRRADGLDGYFVEPTVFADVEPLSTIEQEEIFGPVLAVVKARDFDHALDIANDTQYGLTGSVYSRNRYNLEKARRRFHVGNLYFNRKCTGALVGVHPFGGFNMSGTDSKAGGRDYLLLFLQAKSVSEVL